MEYYSRLGGAQYLAYPPVVAGGPRANTIHYTKNDQLVDDGDMVLMDAGKGQANLLFHFQCSATQHCTRLSVPWLY